MRIVKAGSKRIVLDHVRWVETNTDGSGSLGWCRGNFQSYSLRASEMTEFLEAIDNLPPESDGIAALVRRIQHLEDVLAHESHERQDVEQRLARMKKDFVEVCEQRNEAQSELRRLEEGAPDET